MPPQHWRRKYAEARVQVVFFGAVGVIYANGIFARGVRQMRFFEAKSGPGANLFLMLGLFP